MKDLKLMFTLGHRKKQTNKQTKNKKFKQKKGKVKPGGGRTRL